MGEFLYPGTKARKLNIEISVTFFPGNVAVKSIPFVVYQVRLQVTAICSF